MEFRIADIFVVFLVLGGKAISLSQLSLMLDVGFFVDTLYEND